MKRSGTRILTTHVGSLIRPAELLERSQGGKGVPAGAAPDTNDAALRDRGRRRAAGGRRHRHRQRRRIRQVELVELRARATDRFRARPDRLFEPVWLGRDRIRFREFMKDEFPRGATGVPGHVCVAPIAYSGHEAIRRNIAALKAALAGGWCSRKAFSPPSRRGAPATIRPTSTTPTIATTSSRLPRRCARSISRSSTPA